MQKIIILLILAVSYVGCESMATLSEHVAGAGLAPGKGLVLINATLDEEAEGSACVLVLKPKEGNGTFAMSLRRQGAPQAFPVPPGKYSFFRIRCGGQREFLISDLLPYEIQVLDGKLSVIGNLLVKFDRESNHAFIRLTDGRAGHHKEFQDSINRNRLPTISAFNGKTIAPAMYALGGEGTWSWQVFYDPKSNPKYDQSRINLDGFSECERREFQWNPLRLGALQYTVEFSSGVVQKVEAGPASHVFGDNFIDCVTTTLKTLKIEAKGKAKMQVTFK